MSTSTQKRRGKNNLAVRAGIFQNAKKIYSIYSVPVLSHDPPLPDTEGAGRRADESLRVQSGSYSAKD